MWPFIKELSDYSHGGGGPTIGELTCGGSPNLSCKRDQIKMRDYMDRRLIPPKRVTSPTWGLPPPCKQALTSGSFMMLQMDVITKWRYTGDWKVTVQYPHHKSIVFRNTKNTPTSWLSFPRYFSCDCVLHVSKLVSYITRWNLKMEQVSFRLNLVYLICFNFFPYIRKSSLFFCALLR